MYTEITDNSDVRPTPGWVLYDAGCRYCTGLIARFKPDLEAGGFLPEPLQSAWVRERLNLPEKALLAEMRVLTSGGQVYGGADALIFLANEFPAPVRPWWAWLLVVASRIPFARPLLRSVYRWIAARRDCSQGACRISGSPAPKRGGSQ